MINIFYGRENINKNKYMYEQIKGNSIILVPDQYTLQGERDALFYLNVESLIDIEVLSFSRLIDRVFAECGISANLIDKQGRHMLLNKVLKENKENLNIYKGYENNTNFIELMNNLISEMKQNSVDESSLYDFTMDVSQDKLLRRKMEDIHTIFKAYSKEIEDKYIDTEDLSTLCVEKIPESKFIKKEIWISGFDTFSEKNLEIISALEKYAVKLNIVITHDNKSKDSNLFGISDFLIRRLGDYAEDLNLCQITNDYKIKKSAGICHIEKELFKEPGEKSIDSSGIKIVKSANIYAEAETAAEYIVELTRDKGYRYKDIAVICNDLETRGKIIERMFKLYDLDLFVDTKRDILFSPVAIFVVSILEIIAKGFSAENVLKYLKTGFSELTDDEINDLENYAKKYSKRRDFFKLPFEKAGMDFKREKVLELEEKRKLIVEPILQFNENFINVKTVKEKINIFFKFLSEEMKLPEMISQLVDRQIELERIEIAEETAQIWNEIVNIFDQMNEIIGEEKISKVDFYDLFLAGISAVEIGVLPPTVDGLVLGTMQRTRIGNVKAVVVVGANEGILPTEPAEKDLLNEDEKILLADKGARLCKLDNIRTMEEKIAIYRNLTKCTEELFISYSTSDLDGKQILPSSIFLKIKDIFPGLMEEKDITNSSRLDKLISTPESTMLHMIDKFTDLESIEKIDPIWLEVFSVLKNENGMEIIKDGINFENDIRDVSKNIVKDLYKRDKNGRLVLSPSRLEKFGRCPFAHFVNYGLRPKTIEPYSISAVEIGDLCHLCLMKLSEKLSKDGEKITSPESEWMKITDEGIEILVTDILKDIAINYKDGLLAYSKEEEFRTKLIRGLCIQSGKMAIGQVRKGKIEKMSFEAEFGKNGEFPEIGVDEEDVIIEGKIDRVDILENGRGKVIDYKSGVDKYSETAALVGWKIQLFVYLQAILSNEVLPGGAFYFHVKEEKINMGNISKSDEFSEIVQTNLEKAFKMDGVYVNEKSVVESIDPTDKIIKNSKKAGLKEEEFEQLLGKVMDNTKKMARDIANGKIQATPKRLDKQSACTYCEYKNICKFDKTMPGYHEEKYK